MSKFRHRLDIGFYYRGIPINAPEGIHEDCIKLLARYVPKGSLVADLGAGCGAFTQRMLDNSYRVDPFDLDGSDWAVKDQELILTDLDAPEWELEAGKYDAVVAVEVIEHLENPSAFMRNARRLLKPGGILLVSTPNVVSVKSRRLLLFNGTLDFFNDEGLRAGHRSILPYWLFGGMLAIEGYDVKETAFIAQKPVVFRPGRQWWKIPFVSILDLFIFIIGIRITKKAAFSTTVAFVATPQLTNLIAPSQ